MGYCYLYKRGRGSGGGALGTVKTVLGSIISLTDSTNGKLKGLRIFGKTIQNGTPAPDAPVPLESVGDDGNVIVFASKSQTDANPQTATFNTPNGLHGIPVTSGGNYTDENRQIRLCDEIDGGRGVHVQRLFEILLNGTEKWNAGSAQGGKTRFSCAAFSTQLKPVADTYKKANLLCSNFPTISAEDSYAGIVGIAVSNNSRLYVSHEGIEQTAAGITAYFAANPTTVIAELITPIETPLSAEELAQYAALHTNKPNTTIFNDEGAGMEVKYMSGG